MRPQLVPESLGEDAVEPEDPEFARYLRNRGRDLLSNDRITSYNVCYTKLLRLEGLWRDAPVAEPAAQRGLGLGVAVAPRAGPGLGVEHGSAGQRFVAVISTGRSRRSAPCLTASAIGTPSARSWRKRNNFV